MGLKVNANKSHFAVSEIEYLGHWITIGHDLMSQLGMILNFDGQTMMWDESTIKMKEYEDLLDINSPINKFYQWTHPLIHTFNLTPFL